MTQQLMSVNGLVPDIFDPIQCRRRGRDGSETYIQNLIEGKAEGIKMSLDPEGERRGAFSVDIRDGVSGEYIHRHFGRFRIGESGITVVDDPDLPEGLWDEDTQTFIPDGRSYAREGHQRYNLGGNYGPVELQLRLHGRYSGNGVVLTVGYENAVNDSEIAYQSRMDGWGFYDIDLICTSSVPTADLQFPYVETENFDLLTPGTVVTSYEKEKMTFNTTLSGAGTEAVVAAEAAEAVGGVGSALKTTYADLDVAKSVYSTGVLIQPDRIVSGVQQFSTKSVVGLKIAKTPTGEIGDTESHTNLRLGVTLGGSNGLKSFASLYRRSADWIGTSNSIVWNGTGFEALDLSSLPVTPLTSFVPVKYEVENGVGTKLTIGTTEFQNVFNQDIDEVYDYLANEGYEEEAEVIYAEGDLLVIVDWSNVDGVDCSHIPAILFNGNIANMVNPDVGAQITMYTRENFSTSAVRTPREDVMDDILFELDGVLV